MKRFGVVLLLLGIIMALGTPVIAADAKFFGEFYLQGWYNKNHSLIEKDSARFTAPGAATVDPRDLRGSSAFYTQRLRMGMNFQVAKGLSFVTRFDALERKWMAARKTAPSGGVSPGYSGTDSEAENIAWEVAYVQFFTPIGLFTIGNVPQSACSGTCYSDGVGFSSGIMNWTLPKGPWIITATYKKSTEGYVITSVPGGTPIGGGTDNDSDTYQIGGSYRWNTGSVGVGLTWIESTTANVPTIGWRKTVIPAISMYFVNKFGKLYIGEEFGMVHGGKYLHWNPALGGNFPYHDVKNSFAFSNAFNVELDLAPAKAGFWWIVSRGDDPDTQDKKEGGFRGVLDLDRGFNPCLIMFNEDYMQWMGGGTGGAQNWGGLVGNATSSSSSASANYLTTYVQNVWLYQLYGGFKISPKLNLDASFTYAYAFEKPTQNGRPASAGGVRFLSDKYGYEADVTLKYKIYDNLEYMIGAAYLWTGDYFKGTNANVKLSDNYLITHKLTLTF